MSNISGGGGQDSNIHTDELSVDAVSTRQGIQINHLKYMLGKTVLELIEHNFFFWRSELQIEELKYAILLKT